MDSFLIMLGMCVLAVALWALVRGRAVWGLIASRKAAALVGSVGLAAMVGGTMITPTTRWRSPRPRARPRRLLCPPSR